MYQINDTITVMDNVDGKTHRITRNFLETEQIGSNAIKHRVITIGIKSVPESLKMEFIERLSLYETNDSKMAQSMVQKFIVIIGKYNSKEKKIMNTAEMRITLDENGKIETNGEGSVLDIMCMLMASVEGLIERANEEDKDDIIKSFERFLEHQ